MSGPGRVRVHIDTRTIHRDVWVVQRRVTGEVRVIAGRLEKVDLHTLSFRIRDDVGNTIDLDHVRDADEAAKAVGSQVRARGRAINNRAGALVALGDAELEPDHKLPDMRLSEPVSLAEILELAPGPDPEGAIDLTDEEFATFLNSVRS